MTLARSARKPRFWMALLAAPLALGLWTLPTPHAWADAESSKEYYQDALDWLNKGDFRAAVIQLRNALQEDPENHSARQLLGRLYLEAGNLNAALKELEYVHNAQPTDETEVFVGRALLGLRQYQDVLDTVRAQADDPKFSDAKNLIRAEALFALNRLDAAAKLVQPFLSREQTSVPASLLMARIEARRGNSEQADDYIDATLVAQPDLIDAHILRAQIALQARDLDRVLQMADKIEEIAPDDPRAKLMRAEALVRKNELEEAEAVLAAFVKDYPEATSAIYLHARVLMLLSRYQEADAELLKLPAEVRTQPAASLVIGLVKYQLEQFAQAEEALQRFVAAAGERGRQARRLLASIQLQTARPAAALETLEPLTGSGSGDVAALQLAASAAVRVGDLDTAQRHLQRVTQVGAPDDRRQAVTFLRVLANGQRDENGKLMLDPIALGVLRALD